MAFDFPATPSIGSTYVVGGITYVFDGVAWNAASAPSGKTAEARNRFTNPAMWISQENQSTPGSNSGYYAADQWALVLITAGTITLSRPIERTPGGSVYRLRATVVTADTSIATNDIVMINQPIEGVNVADFHWGSAAAQQVVLRIGCRGPAGTYTATIRSGASPWKSFNANFTISAGEAMQDIARYFVIPAEAVGTTWPTEAVLGMIFSLVLMSGTQWQGPNNAWADGNFTGTAQTSNFMATVGNSFDLFDVGLHRDPDKTGIAPPWQLPAYDDELRHCQRYWYLSQNPNETIGNRWGGAGQGGMDFGTIIFPAPMRAIPTAAIVVNPTYQNCSALAFAQGNVTGCCLRGTVTASGAYRVVNGEFSFNARM